MEYLSAESIQNQIDILNNQLDRLKLIKSCSDKDILRYRKAFVKDINHDIEVLRKGKANIAYLNIFELKNTLNETKIQLLKLRMERPDLIALPARLNIIADELSSEILLLLITNSLI